MRPGGTRLPGTTRCFPVATPSFGRATLDGNEHVWHIYTVRVPGRDRVLEQLHSVGIGAGIHYPVPVHLTPAFAGLGYAPGAFPVAERTAQELLSLPLFPEITAEQQQRVATALMSAL